MSKILVVDDEVGIRELLRDALIRSGYEVTTVPSTDQALAAIFEQPYDLVLLDVNISGDSGITVLSKIREHKKAMPVVIYSGVVTAELEEEAKKAGADAILGKDIGVIELVKKISPFVKGEEKPGAVSEEAPAAPVVKAETNILIVDDEEEVRDVLIAFFQKKGYKTHQAEDGEKALAIARAEDLSVVLLDIEMPVMDGLTTLEKLLAMQPGLCVVMVTGRQDDDKVKRALELGAYNYVLKPFEFLYLELVIKSKLKSAQ